MAKTYVETLKKVGTVTWIIFFIFALLYCLSIAIPIVTHPLFSLYLIFNFIA